MPNAVVTIYAKTVTFNLVTYDATSGGPIRCEYTLSGDPLADYTGDNNFSPFVAVVNQKCVVRVRLREIKRTEAPGAKSNLVITCTGKANTVTLTFANMVYLGVEPGEQERAAAGSATMVFQHESADGAAFPLT